MFWCFREQGAGAVEKNILGSWGERSFFFKGAGRKEPPIPWGEGLINTSGETIVELAAQCRKSFVFLHCRQFQV